MSKNWKIGVVGAGNMGSGIAQKMAQEGLEVVLVDVSSEQAARGLATINRFLREGTERGILSARQAEATLGRIVATDRFEALKEADLVVEAVFENLDVKGEVFRRLDRICDEKTILATNTSSLYVRDIANYTRRPDRVVGMHYFYHPAKNRLVEIVPHAATSAETVERAKLIGKLHNKTCIVVKDSPGFAVNRYFVPFLNESVRLLEDGVANIPTIEAAAKQAFEIGMGPFELMNVTGIPIAVHSSAYLAKEISEFYAPARRLIEQSEKKEDWDLSGEVDESRLDRIGRHLCAAVFGAAGAQVDEGVAGIEDTDRGAKIGLRWKWGPFELMNKVGVEQAYDMVKELNARRPGFHLPEIMKKQALQGTPFAFRYVDLEVKNRIAYITINRPEAMNALNPAVVDQLEAAFDQAEKDPGVRGIAIRGAGKAFVAGADIKFFIDCIQRDEIDQNVAFTRRGHRLFRRFETSDKMTVAVLDGLSLGGGSELALACQAIVATEQGSLAFPESGLGIYPGLGGMLRTNLHLGKELAKYYTFTGSKLSAQDAHSLGIVTELVEMEEVEAAIERLVQAGNRDKYQAREIPAAYREYQAAFSDENVKRLFHGETAQGVRGELAERLGKILSFKGLIALETMNDLIDRQSNLSIEEGMELELDGLTKIFATEDAVAGLTAALSGERPAFKFKIGRSVAYHEQA
ncbi:3-hydroxyacyl-CoA dehydrogenase/enoyl-CoA hydratase family protein [Cohnella caldifontis]|uniref:3-hydroxyacyl-CoA dehydrogenase/enoyl-CoA hydratase family protein n=1 Tax=Cohnella caldifontis TaxID=3027471 RepID=UPI0023ED4DC5|nr:3-hydroxyacyl-CoA dehydrogenase/enoyl-CoA hydratase family protein [Cohnella sp. YIM B05605]